MLLIRVVFLGALICLHVVGGAVLFRTLFPRESPWWGFFLPPLVLVALLNFIEHFLALPTLVWLLPFSTCGLTWFMLAHPARIWKGLGLPSALFTAAFCFAVAIKCLQPDVNFYCTEGLTDLNRILDFCLGDKVPPTDCWLPPYSHAGYYTFMHYGASVLKRLFSVDVGTAYNFGGALLNSLVLLTAAAAAHSLSRYRNWVAILTFIVVAGGFTGSTPISALLHPRDPNPVGSIDIAGGWDDPGQHNDYASLLRRFPPESACRIYTPGCYLYYSEFHATIAGHFLVLLAVFGAVEVLRRKRSVAPWIYLAVAPALTVISCPWFFFLVAFLSWPTLLLAWAAGRTPYRWSLAFAGTAAALALLWPTVCSLTLGAIPQPLYWFTDLRHDLGILIVQLWPLYVPWLALCFVWPRLGLAARWLHAGLLPLFFFVELVFFEERGTTLEKTMSGFFGIGLVILCPLLFTQRGWVYRGLSGVIALAGLLSLCAWSESIYEATDWQGSFLHVEGDYFLQRVPQLHRMKEVLGRLHARTVLTGKNSVAFFESPSLPAFTDNRSYLGWTNAEESCGHADEAHQRALETNAFYDGTIPSPLNFLQAGDISAVLVWPDDKMSDDWLNRIKTRLDPEYTYFDCKGDGPNNAGVFLKRADLQAGRN